MARRTVEVECTAYGEASLDDFDTEALVDELRERGVSVQSANAASAEAKQEGPEYTLLRRICYEHDALGVPLAEVLADVLREYRVPRNCPSYGMPSVWPQISPNRAKATPA